MKLSCVDIVNFRSIKKLTVDLDPTCRVLVGINESGKSNILEALALLAPERLPKKEDVREPLPDEPPITKASIRFVFKIDNSETKEVFESLCSKMLSSNKTTPMLKKSKEEINLKDFCRSVDEGLYCVDVFNEEKVAKYWTINTSYKILENWKKPSNACPDEYSFEVKTGEEVNPKEFALININEFKDIPLEYLEDVSTEDINELVGQEITRIVEEQLPETILWVYDEKHLLPATINLDTFAISPDTCLPLKNMFTLAGVSDIKKGIDNAQQVSRNALCNFLTSIANKTTVHFRNVWKEYKLVEFGLEHDGGNIIPIVKEKNRYAFSKRSDGFKRFVSFLLMISTNVKMGLLKDALLLIDEPDISLHPSGARFLRDELIKISKKNYVVYSTHSIFMIDGEDISRHIIVSKKDEKTSIEDADESNIVEEEVIYNALGYSIYETLKKKNIIFEGWRDKKLFKVALKNVPRDYGRLKDVFKNIGICHAEGVKHIKNVTPILEFVQRDCVIISDCDETALEKQREYNRSDGYGIWRTYKEINTDICAVTGEDFIKIEVFNKLLRQAKKKYPELTNIDAPEFSCSGERLLVIDEWLKESGLDTSKRKEIKDEIKKKIFGELKPSHIDESYYKLLNSLALMFNQT